MVSEHGTKHQEPARVLLEAVCAHQQMLFAQVAGSMHAALSWRISSRARAFSRKMIRHSNLSHAREDRNDILNLRAPSTPSSDRLDRHQSVPAGSPKAHVRVHRPDSLSVTAREGCGYAFAQIAGCCAGAVLAHAMFDLPLIQLSAHVRTGPPVWLSEVVATTGLVLVILGAPHSSDVPWMVASWIGAAYWFTASTSFANPAISIARSLSDTFAGIRPIDVPAFVVCQLVGAFIGLALGRLMFRVHPAQALPATPQD